MLCYVPVSMLLYRVFNEIAVICVDGFFPKEVQQDPRYDGGSRHHTSNFLDSILSFDFVE